MIVKDNTRWLFLLGLTGAVLIGAFCRVYLCWDLTLSMDDFSHMHFSGYPTYNPFVKEARISFAEMINLSYADAHPPLRNIILYALLPYAESPLVIRAVCLIPGILLIATFPLLVKSLGFSVSTTLIFAFGLAFSPSLIQLSYQSRGYMLLMLLLSLFWLALNRYFSDRKKGQLLISFAFASLALFTEYCAIFIILPVGIAYAFSIFKRDSLRGMASLLLPATGILAICLVQYYLLSSNASIEKHSELARYSDWMTVDLELWAKNFYIGLFRFAPLALPVGTRQSLCILFFVGLATLIKNKQYRIIGFILLSYATIFLFAALGQYPFTSNRQCIFLFFPISLGCLAGLNACLSLIRLKSLKTLAVVGLCSVQFYSITGALGLSSQMSTWYDTPLSLWNMTIETQTLTRGIMFIENEAQKDPSRIFTRHPRVVFLSRGQNDVPPFQRSIARNMRGILSREKKNLNKSPSSLFSFLSKKRIGIETILAKSAWKDMDSLFDGDFSLRNDALEQMKETVRPGERIWIFPWAPAFRKRTPYPTESAPKPIPLKNSEYTLVYYPKFALFSMSRDVPKTNAWRLAPLYFKANTPARDLLSDTSL